MKFLGKEKEVELFKVDIDKITNELPELKNWISQNNFLNWERWFNSGRNIFHFNKELLNLLSQTDVDDVTPDSFHLPFDNFYLSLKDLGIHPSDDYRNPIDGVYVYKDDSADPEEYKLILHFDFVGEFEELYLRFKDKIWDNFSGDESAKFWHFSFFFDALGKVKTVKEAIKSYNELFRESYLPEDSSTVTDDHLDLLNYNSKFIDSTVRLIVNCMLYLSLPIEDKDIETEYPSDLPHNLNRKLRLSRTNKERGQIEKKINDSGFSKITLVGKSFSRPNKELNREAQTNPHWRRGHWRNQKFGEGLSFKKLIWIMPTIVNKQSGDPTKGHIYVD